jgi:hypothetical protein
MDDEPYGAAEIPWENDTAEVFLDSANDKAPRWGSHGHQLVFAYGASGVVEALRARDPTGVLAAARPMLGQSSGYVVELKISELALGKSSAVGSFIGFDVQVNDCGRDGKRRRKLAWHSRKNDAFEAPAHLGTLELR